MQQTGVRARGGETRAERIFKHVAGPAGVLADDHLGLVVLSVVPSELTADTEGVVHGQVDIGLTAKTVGSEVFTHMYSSSY